MSRAWGAICPDDGGILLDHADWGGKLWCPNNRHGGNGAFYDPAVVTEGWVSHRPAPRPVEVRAADIIRATPEPVKPGPAQSARPRDATAGGARAPKECKCGCGGMTKGGTFLPGHDARYHARLKAEGAQHGNT